MLVMSGGASAADSKQYKCTFINEGTTERKVRSFSGGTTLRQLAEAVAADFDLQLPDFKLLLSRPSGEESVIDPLDSLTVHGLMLSECKINRFLLREQEAGALDRKRTAPGTGFADESTSKKRGWSGATDGYAASASNPTEGPVYGPAAAPTLVVTDLDSAPGSSYVGLANQGATCYLNSLLQSLFMTPEFRRAIYANSVPVIRSGRHSSRGSSKSPVAGKAAAGDVATAATTSTASKPTIILDLDSDDEDDSDGEKKAPRPIPFELQRLFVRLQFSKERAVETTAITKSFGWDRAESFQQHDVQELLRVLFDALEEEWAGTPLSSAIQDLYEGELLDYVLCTECQNESLRTDKFMDVPLVIKPFGVSKPMTSVDESLRKFVEVERLEGDNQYMCDQCKKKVDALKGLRFKKLPYLLTMQLKRFDFDYDTMRRIKLNSRFHFPLELDMTPYMKTSGTDSGVGSEASLTTPAPEATEVSTHSVHSAASTLATAPSSFSQGEEDAPAEAAAGAPAAASEPINGHAGSERDSTQATTTTSASSSRSSSPAPAADASSSDQAQTGLTAEQRQAAIANGYLYELFSIMIHSGSALAGHYYAFIKNLDSGQWLTFNDSSVRPMSQSELETAYGGDTYGRNSYSALYTSSTNAYMLMYRRVDPLKNKTFPSASELPPEVMAALDKMEAAEKMKKEREEKRRRMISFEAYLYTTESITKPVKHSLDIDRSETLCHALAEMRKVVGVPEHVPEAHVRLCRYVPVRNQLMEVVSFPLDTTLEDANFISCYTVYNVALQLADANGVFEDVDPSILNLLVLLYDPVTDSFGTLKSFKVKHSSPLADYQDAIAKVYNCRSRQVRLAKNVTHSSPRLLTADYRSIADSFLIRGGDVLYCDIVPEDREYLTADPPESEAGGEAATVASTTSSNETSEAQSAEPLDIKPLTASMSSATTESESSIGPVDKVLDDLDAEERAFVETLDSDKSISRAREAAFRASKAFQKLEAMSNEIEIQLVLPASKRRDGRAEETVKVDKRMTLEEFKNKIVQPFMAPHTPQEFKLLRVRPPSDERKELFELSDLLRNLALDYYNRVEVELGRPIQPGEHAVELYWLRLDNAPAVELCDDCRVSEKMDSQQLRAAIAQHLQHMRATRPDSLPKDMNLPTDPQYYRIWDTTRSLVPRLALSMQSTCPTLYHGKPLLVEIRDAPEDKLSKNDVVIFLRHWHPDTFALDGLKSITVPVDSVLGDVMKKVSDLSGIPADCVRLARPTGAYPYHSNVLDIEGLDWSQKETLKLNNAPLPIIIDGEAFLFKDSRAVVKELSAEDKAALEKEEEKRAKRSAASTNYYSRPEKGLKIFRRKRDTATDGSRTGESSEATSGVTSPHETSAAGSPKSGSGRTSPSTELLGNKLATTTL